MSLSQATDKISISTSAIFDSLLADVQSVHKKVGNFRFGELVVELHRLFAEAERACMTKLLAQFD